MEVLSLTLLRVTLTGRDLVGPGVRVGAQVNHVRAILPVASQWTCPPPCRSRTGPWMESVKPFPQSGWAAAPARGPDGWVCCPLGGERSGQEQTVWLGGGPGCQATIATLLPLEVQEAW